MAIYESSVDLIIQLFIVQSNKYGTNYKEKFANVSTIFLGHLQRKCDDVIKNNKRFYIGVNYKVCHLK